MLALTCQMPLANLCKPTYCHRHPVGPSNPDPPACAVATSASVLRVFVPYSHTEESTTPSTEAPASRKRHPWYRVATRLVPRRQLSTLTISPSGSPAFPDGAHADLLSLRANRGRVHPDIPCRALSLSRTASGSPKRARASSPHDAPTPHDFNTQDIFRRQIPSTCAPHRSEERSFMGRHWYLCLAASTQLPTWFRARLSRARPFGDRLLHQRLRATCRLSTSAIKKNYEHTQEDPKPRRLLGQERTPTLRSSDVVPCGTTTTKASQARGCYGV
jgi:hypothetical protein